jgi:diguanylate cyclase (GGDEF)-like protein
MNPSAAEPALRPSRLFGVAVAASLLALICFVVELRGQPGGAHITRDVDDLVQLASAAAMAGAGFWRARRERGRRRLSWQLIASGGACWAGGQAVWSYFEIFTSQQTPFPSLADAGYLMLPALAMAGLLVRPSQAFVGRGRLRVGLDITLVLASLFTVSWATALGEVYRQGSDSVFARAVSLMYPAGDIALLTIVVTVLAFAQAGARSGLLCIGAGLGGLAVADSGFAYLTATGAYRTGNLIDACWVGGFTILGWAALLDRSGAERPRRPGTSYLTLGLPYLPSAVGIAMAVWQLGPSTSDEFLLGAAGVMVVVLLARQLVVVLDNSKLVERMHYQAFHDVLTGLANRSLFNDRLTHALDLRHRDQRPLAVLLVDLDNFKLVNDSLGHSAGDELLIEIGTRMRATVRAGDTVARLGGDEFAILVEDGGDPAEIARRIVTGLAAPIRVGDRDILSGGSIGVVALDDAEVAVSASEVLKRADIAMYAAKRAGKGAARFYTSDLARLSSGQLDMRAALLADVAAGQIDVALQPIYLSDGSLHGVEALARWRHCGQVVPPAAFVSLARDLGCVAALDEIVLRKAARVVAPLGTLRLSVNLDCRTLADRGFVGRLRRELHACGLPMNRLAVEVVEFDLVERSEGALESLQQLRRAGALIVVDDFGAGYATVARLRALKPDVLKIDRSIVAAGDEDPTAAALLAGTAQLARHIGASVIAEGIETAGQMQAAIAAGCDALQGFLLGKPIDEHDLVRLVAGARPNSAFESV